MVAQRQHLDTDDIRARIDCQRLAEHLLGDTGKRSGKAVIYSNPKVQQRTPSFAVYPDGFKDHKTGESGDLFDLIMLATGYDFPTALSYAANFAGLSIDAPTLHIVKPAQLTQQPRQTSAQWRTSAAQEVTRCTAYLWGDTPDARAVLAYLHTVRGLTDETIRAARLGYNPDFHKIAITKDDGKAAYLLPGITIPWYDSDGQIVAVRVRCRIGNLADALSIKPDTDRAGEALPKYVSLSGSIMAGAFYGTIRSDCVVLLVEGEFDTLIGQQNAPDGVCVVTLGSASGSLSPACRDALIAAPRVVLALDTDDAGQKAAARLAEALHKANVYTSAVPSGKDLTGYITEHDGMTADLITSACRLPLPDAWRAALNRYAAAPVAPTIELFIEAQRAGLFDETEGATVAELIAFGEQLGRNVSADTIRRGLAASIDLFAVLLPIFSYNKERGIEGGKTAIKSGSNRGRPEKRYTLASSAVVYATILAHADPRILESHFGGDAIATIRVKLLQALDVDDATSAAATLIEHYAQALDTEAQRQALEAARVEARQLRRDLMCLASSPLPIGWHYTNAAEYRACLTRAFVEAHDGEQVRRVELAKQIGIAPRTLYTVQRAAGLLAKPVFVECTATRAADLAPHYSSKHGGYVKHAVINGQVISLVNKDGQHDAQAALEAGQTVMLRVQQANTIHVVSAIQPCRAEQVIVPKDTSVLAVAAAIDKKPVISAPKKAEFYGTGHDPVWAEQQINNILSAVTVWRRNGTIIVNTETGERVIYSVSQVLALLLDKPLISVDRACDLHSAACLAERVSQITGNAPGVGRAEYMATLTDGERDALNRFAGGETW